MALQSDAQSAGNTRWLLALQLVCLCVLCTRPAAAAAASQQQSLTSGQFGAGEWETAFPVPSTSHAAADGFNLPQSVSAAAQQPPKPGAKGLTGKTNLLPLDRIDIALLAVIMFSLSLAGGAGIGGGAILVPVYLMLRGEDQACQAGCSLVLVPSPVKGLPA
jgi:hypothetical protein